jgi:hypothetical protein
MKAGINGIGIWGPGLNGWDNFLLGLEHGFSIPEDQPKAPTPTSIPARERRRAPLTVKLASEVIQQAATMASVSQAELCSVFSSAMGDSHITDYMCKVLAGPQKMLSPTKFHNSVHNTPSGYWSIGAENRQPSTFVSGFQNSMPVALLESVTLANSEAKPTVLVIYDVAFGQPLFDTSPTSEDFAAAFVITPESAASRWSIDLEYVTGTDEQSEPNNDFLRTRAAHNPAATALALCEACAANQQRLIHWPVDGTDGSALAVTLSPT